MKPNYSQSEGKVSQWNEGDLMNLRIHHAKEMINYSKILPFKKIYVPSFDTYEYGYKLWFIGIDNLYGEGVAKYSEQEIKEVEEMRDKIETIINQKQICTEFQNRKYKGVTVDEISWDKLKEKLREFERKVKRTNDEHGLGSRNFDEEEGL